MCPKMNRERNDTQMAVICSPASLILFITGRSVLDLLKERDGGQSNTSLEVVAIPKTG